MLKGIKSDNYIPKESIFKRIKGKIKNFKTNKYWEDLS